MMLNVKSFFFKCCSWGVIFLSVSVLIKYYMISPFRTSSTIYSSYSYIIVGGGTAGCVIASRLSEIEDVNILLIEAGGELSYLSKIPIAPTLLQRGQNDWSMVTTPQKYSSFGLTDQTQFLPRGKGLGGSGQINYLLHGLGLPADYENWIKNGVEGWSYSTLQHLFENIFCYGDCQNSQYKPQIRLTSVDDVLRNITEIFQESAIQLTGAFKMNVTPFFNTIFNGERESSYLRYLKPYLWRKNLHVLPSTLVSKIIFKDKTAHSIEIVLENNQSQYITANNEIIISCGSIKTPQLLMLSGIGPKSELQKHNISIISSLENVGKNLHDHLNMPLYVTIEKSLSLTLSKIKSFKTIFKYFWHGKGYMSSPGVVALGRGKNHSSLMLFSMGSTDEVLLREIANTKKDTFYAFFPHHNNSSQEGFVFLSTCLQPISRGSITLQNKNPHSSPIIDPNYLSQQFDVNCTINSMRLAINVINTPIFKNIGASIHWPTIGECKKLWTDVISDEYLECITRFGALTGHHAAGTCSMGGSLSVVDKNLRVRGVTGLRVVDASILPTPLSSSPNSVLIAIAERASELIKESRKQIFQQ